jgi:outer membrane protein OmpA-like peptidoglycan-associated protein
MSTLRTHLQSRSTILRTAVAATLVTLGACASSPPINSALEDARSMYSQTQTNSAVNTYAQLELKEAGDALGRAERAWNDDAKPARVDHLAYLAYQRSAIAQEAARMRLAEATVLTATAERDRVQLAARTNDARRAEMVAANAQQRAEMSRQQAEQAQNAAAMQAAQAREAEARASATGQQTRDAEARASAAGQQTREAEARALAADQQAREAEARAQLLASQLSELAAQKTERGMVITLGGDVLFDVDQAVLKPGAMRSLAKVGDFMKRYPERKLVVEGFTDSTGSDAHNMDLSQRRAQAVGQAIVAAGIDPARVLVQGYGESFPVASNDSSAGRQMNRRVEVIISNDGAEVAPRMAASRITPR